MSPNIVILGSMKLGEYNVLYPHPIDPVLFVTDHDAAYAKAQAVFYPAMDRADVILVYSPDGVIGEHTRADMDYAIGIGKTPILIRDLQHLQDEVTRLTTENESLKKNQIPDKPHGEAMTIKELQERHRAEVKALQSNCKHEKKKVMLVKWGEYQDWVDRTCSDFDNGEVCETCGKTLRRIEYSPLLDHDGDEIPEGELPWYAKQRVKPIP